MIKKPQPKMDLIITNAFKGNGFGKNIFPYTDQAREWIETTAMDFGELIYPTTENMPGVVAMIDHRPRRSYRLLIDRCYDPEEVVEYLMQGYQEWKVTLNHDIWENGWDEPKEEIDDNNIQGKGEFDE